MRKLNALVISIFFACSVPGISFAQNAEEPLWVINTGNKYKKADYGRMLSALKPAFMSLEVPEISANSVDEVAMFKASAFRLDRNNVRVITEDTAMEVEGAKIGVNVKHLLKTLPNYAGRRVTWTVVLAYQYQDQVFLFKGETKGKLIPPRDPLSDPFEQMFLADGEEKPFIDGRPDRVNPRSKATEALLRNQPLRVVSVQKIWQGQYQPSGSALESIQIATLDLASGKRIFVRFPGEQVTEVKLTKKNAASGKELLLIDGINKSHRRAMLEDDKVKGQLHELGINGFATTNGKSAVGLNSELIIIQPRNQNPDGSGEVPVVTKSIRTAFSHVNPGDIVVLDLDNTVFMPNQMLGSPEWFDHFIEEKKKMGIPFIEALQEARALTLQTYEASSVHPVDPNIASYIKSLQKRGIPVVALTARPSSWLSVTLQQLREIGVTFSSSFPNLQNESLDGDVSIHDGIIFAANKHKGEVLSLFLEKSGLQPNAVTMVDDRLNNLTDVRSSMERMHIVTKLWRYSATDHVVKSFDPKVASIQLSTLKRTGKVISDQDARRILSGASKAASLDADTVKAISPNASSCRSIFFKFNISH